MINRITYITIFLIAILIAKSQVVSQDSIKAPKILSAEAVTLVNFTATFFGDKIKIKWITAYEKNIKEFYVHRSVDATNWYVVANLPGHLISSTIKNYESLDKTAAGGINFYKLSYIDSAGNSTDLKIVKIELEDKTKEIKVTPDNIHSTIKLESAEPINSIDLELTDMLERSYRVSFVTDNTHEITIITGQLTPGVYFLKSYLNKNRTVFKKIIVN